jgi:hypothetical protein
MSEKQEVGRRRFLGVVGGTAAGLIVGGIVGSVATSASMGHQL